MTADTTPTQRNAKRRPSGMDQGGASNQPATASDNIPTGCDEFARVDADLYDLVPALNAARRRELCAAALDLVKEILDASPAAGWSYDRVLTLGELEGLVAELQHIEESDRIRVPLRPGGGTP